MSETEGFTFIHLSSTYFRCLSTMSLRRGVGADPGRLYTYQKDIFFPIFLLISSTLIIGMYEYLLNWHSDNQKQKDIFFPFFLLISSTLFMGMYEYLLNTNNWYFSTGRYKVSPSGEKLKGLLIIATIIKIFLSKDEERFT